MTAPQDLNDDRRVFPCEREVVTVAIRLLAKLEGYPAGQPTYPDDGNRNTPDVDARVTVGAKTFAIEHTTVEQFDRATEEQLFQRRQRVQWEETAAALGSRLPHGAYDLQIIGPIVAQKNAFPALLNDLVEKAASVARSLLAPPGGNIGTGTVKKGGARVGFRIVRLFDPVGVNKVEAEISFWRRFLGDDEKGARLAVVRRLLGKKCGKLEPYRARGNKSVLVLEDKSFLPGPHSLLHMAEHEIRTQFAGTTDILIVVTCEPDIWTLQHLHIHEGLSRETRPDSLWIWDPCAQQLVKPDLDEGHRRAMLRARGGS